MVLCALLVISAPVHAILITPDTNFRWSGTSPQNPDAGDIATIVRYPGTLVELYKQDQGALADVGDYAESYQTGFFNTPEDPEDATIEYISGPYITGDPIYLLVKDGASNNPVWYIFDMLMLDLNKDGSYEYSWNGTDIIQLQDFWPNQGAISHVSLYGTRQQVAEPATMLLLGAGLIGLAGFGRKKLLKKA
jgi:hypothetical protein